MEDKYGLKSFAISSFPPISLSSSDPQKYTGYFSSLQYTDM